MTLTWRKPAVALQIQGLYNSKALRIYSVPSQVADLFEDDSMLTVVAFAYTQSDRNVTYSRVPERSTIHFWSTVDKKWSSLRDLTVDEPLDKALELLPEGSEVTVKGTRYSLRVPS